MIAYTFSKSIDQSFSLADPSIRSTFARPALFRRGTSLTIWSQRTTASFRSIGFPECQDVDARLAPLQNRAPELGVSRDHLQRWRPPAHRQPSEWGEQQEPRFARLYARSAPSQSRSPERAAVLQRVAVHAQRFWVCRDRVSALFSPTRDGEFRHRAQEIVPSGRIEERRVSPRDV